MMFNIKMTNSFTSNTSCFICARLHVSVLSDHHRPFFESSLKNYMYDVLTVRTMLHL